MSNEEDQVQETENKEVKESKQQDETVELSPLEEQAVSQGWVPLAEWTENGGDADEWRTAKEFIDRGELYRSIHTLRRDQKQLEAKHVAFKKHYDYVFEKAYQKAVADLKKEKRAALKESNLEAVDEIEDRIESLQEERTQAIQEAQQQQQQVQQQEHPTFTAWVGRNPWFTQNVQARTFAEAYGVTYAQNYPGTPPEDILKEVEKAVKQQFPSLTGNVHSREGNGKKAAPNAVAGVNRQARSGTKAKDDIEMDDMERDIMRGLVESGEMTETEYKKELRKVKGL